MLTSRRPHQCISVLCSLLFLYLRYAYSYAYDYACLLASLERTGFCFSTSDDRRVDIVEIPLNPYKPTFSRQENIYDWNTCSLFIYFDTLKFQLYNVIIPTIEQLLRRLPTLELWINKMHLWTQLSMTCSGMKMWRAKRVMNSQVLSPRIGRQYFDH